MSVRARNLIAVLLAAAAAGGLYFAWQTGWLHRLSDYDELVASMRAQQGVRGPLFCILIQFVQVVIFVIPGEVVQLAAGYVFGAWRGFLYSVTGILLGSLTGFMAGRVAGRPFVERILGVETMARADRWLQSPKGRFAIFVAFLIPGTPKDAMSYAAGVTRYGLAEFLLISGLGRTPALLFSTIIRSQLYERDYVMIGISLAAAAVVMVAFYLLQRKMRWMGGSPEPGPGSLPSED